MTKSTAQSEPSSADPHRTEPRLADYVRVHAAPATRGVLLVFASVLISIFAPFLTRYAVDALTAEAVDWQQVAGYAAAYLGAMFVSALLGLWMRKILLGLGHTIEYEIRRDVFEQLTRLDTYYFSRERTGDLMTKMTSDLNSVREFVGQGMLQGARTSMGFLLAFGVMFAIDARLATVMLVLLPTTSLLFFLLLRVIRARYDASQEQFSVISHFAQESFGGIRTIRGYGMEERQRGRFTALNEQYIDLKMALSRVERPLWPAMSLLFGFGVVLILWIGGWQVIRGELTLGEYVQFTQYLFILQWPMLALGWTMNLWQRGLASWKRIAAILQAEPRIQDRPRIEVDTPVRGDVVFDSVSVEMGDRLVLEDINLTVPAGQTLGITGPTGAGKTLLVWLIGRLIEPRAGRILIGGKDIRDWPLHSLRQSIGMAPQEAFLFSDTLANNIAFGLDEADPEKVFSAAEVAQLRPDRSATKRCWASAASPCPAVSDNGRRSAGHWRVIRRS
jgi:ATP-binding cassette subfamily B protein